MFFDFIVSCLMVWMIWILIKLFIEEDIRNCLFGENCVYFGWFCFLNCVSFNFIMGLVFGWVYKF